jgi:hypothetical protein
MPGRTAQRYSASNTLLSKTAVPAAYTTPTASCSQAQAFRRLALGAGLCTVSACAAVILVWVGARSALHAITHHLCPATLLLQAQSRGYCLRTALTVLIAYN